MAVSLKYFALSFVFCNCQRCHVHFLTFMFHNNKNNLLKSIILKRIPYHKLVSISTNIEIFFQIASFFQMWALDFVFFSALWFCYTLFYWHCKPILEGESHTEYFLTALYKITKYGLYNQTRFHMYLIMQTRFHRYFNMQCFVCSSPSRIRLQYQLKQMYAKITKVVKKAKPRGVISVREVVWKKNFYINSHLSSLVLTYGRL